MEWFNLTGLIFVVVLLIPNIIYAVTNKEGFADNYHNKFIEAGEQIGRFGCFILMFIQLPFVTLGYIYDGAQTLYLIFGIVLLALFCKGNCMAKALTLSILPSVLFLESGILTLNIPLIVLSVVFAICHITISCKNTAGNK